MREIYPHIKKTYENRLKKLDTLRPRNKELILGFEEHLFAKGNKIARVSKLLAEMMHLCKLFDKDLDKVDNNDIERVMAKINQMDYSEYTKKDYWRAIKQFYHWHLKAEYSKVIQFQVKYNLNKEIKRDAIITEEDMEKVLKLQLSLRNKAFLSILHETGARIGEILTMNVGSIKKENNIAKVKLRGKTGERDVLVVSCVPHLFKLLSEHPFKDKPEKPLWIKESSYYNECKEPLGYTGAVNLIKNAFEKANLKKQCNPHFFRHSRATILATHLTEVQMCLYFGWEIGSKQVATYVHASGRDVDMAIKGYYGIKLNEKEVRKQPKVCSSCNTVNEEDNVFCSQCGSPLSVKTFMKNQEIINTQIDETMKFFMKIVKNNELMAKFEEFKTKFSA